MTINDVQMVAVWGIIFTLGFIALTGLILFLRNLVIMERIYRNGDVPPRELIEFTHKVYGSILTGQFFGLLFWVITSVVVLIIKH